LALTCELMLPVVLVTVEDPASQAQLTYVELLLFWLLLLLVPCSIVKPSYVKVSTPPPACAEASLSTLFPLELSETPAPLTASIRRWL